MQACLVCIWWHFSLRICFINKHWGWHLAISPVSTLIASFELGYLNSLHIHEIRNQLWHWETWSTWKSCQTSMVHNTQHISYKYLSAFRLNAVPWGKEKKLGRYQFLKCLRLCRNHFNISRGIEFQWAICPLSQSYPFDIKAPLGLFERK